MAFMAPIGTPEERATGIIWPGKWDDANPYDNLYDKGYHTGADLNLNSPHFNLNAHAEVVAMGDGTVTFARLFPNPDAWGNLIVIDHGEVDGKPLFSRYGHVENISVPENAPVVAGQPIANVGNGETMFPYHLHFDISRTDVLRASPGHWPGFNRPLVHIHYVNPQEWLQTHVTGGITNMNIQFARIYYVTASYGLRVREDHRRSARQVGSLLYGAKAYLEDSATVNEDGFVWGQIRSGPYNDDWIAMGLEDQSEMFVSRFAPKV
jgi:hypothetical protein